LRIDYWKVVKVQSFILRQAMKIPKKIFSADSELSSGIVMEKSIISGRTFLIEVNHGKLWKKVSI
jgi:hypothetical protein